MRKVTFGLAILFSGFLGQMATASEKDDLADLCNQLHDDQKFCDCYAGVFLKFSGEENMSHMVEAWEREMDPADIALERGFKKKYDESLVIVNQACF